MDYAEIITTISKAAVTYLPKVLLAVFTLIVGFWIIGYLVKLISTALKNSGLNITLAKFLSSIFNIAFKVMLLLSVAGMFGVETTSFIAILSALMIGVGMALNGTIGQAASGVLLMIFKPFKVGDLVKIGGGPSLGIVDSINAFNTILKTLDNRRIIISNSNITGNDIINISGQGDVGIELTFGIGYGDDIDKAKEVIIQVGKACPYILDTPAQTVVVSGLGDSSVNLSTRPFCKSEDYWVTNFYMLENVKKAFDQNNIGIPYPTMDINISKE